MWESWSNMQDLSLLTVYATLRCCQSSFVWLYKYVAICNHKYLNFQSKYFHINEHFQKIKVATQQKSNELLKSRYHKNDGSKWQRLMNEVVLATEYLYSASEITGFQTPMKSAKPWCLASWTTTKAIYISFFSPVQCSASLGKAGFEKSWLKGKNKNTQFKKYPYSWKHKYVNIPFV